MRDEFSKTGARFFLFDSVSEITAYTDKGKFVKQAGKFTGVELETWEEVEAKAKGLWEEGMVTCHQYMNRLKGEAIPELKSHKRSFVWDVEGDELDLDRMNAGEPKCWKKYAREESNGPVEVTIIIDTTTPFHVDPKDILWRGAAALAMTQLLEEKGYRVELWVTNGSELFVGKQYGVCTACCLKKTSDPLDLGSLVNTVAGWFYRTAIFALLRTIAAKSGETPHESLGRCYTPNGEDLDLISRDELRIYSSGVFTFDGALYMILDEVSKFAKKEE